MWWSEKWSLRDGEESIRGGKIPPPSGASSPADPHRHPRYPKICPGRGAQAHPDQGPWQPGRPTRPHSRGKNYPTPSSSQFPNYITIRHPGKAVYPALLDPPPCGGTDASKTPHQSRAQAHAPTLLPAAHQPTPSPPGPAVTPTRRQSAPRSPNPPPHPDQPGTVRPPGWQPTSAGTGIPSSAACRRQRNSIQKSPIPHPGQGRSPSAEPPKKPTPREPPDAPGPIATPRQQQKPQPDRIGTPPTLGDGADQRSPEIDLMCQQKLFQG